MKSDFRFRRRLIAMLLLAALSAGCDQEAIFKKMVPAEEAAVAKEIVAKLAERDFAPVEAQLDPKLRTPDLRQKLEKIASLLPAENPKSIRTVGAQTIHINSVVTYNLTFEYEFRDKWLVVNTVLERRDGNLSLGFIYLTPIQQSLEEINRFSFEGKSPFHYVVFALAIGIPVLVLYALVVCARTRIAKRKWLWLLFVAVGVFQFHFNWSTGAWSVQPIAFSLLGSGFARMGPVAPWVFTLAFPLGALLFLVKRRSLQSGHEA